MMKAFSFLTILESLSKKLSILRTKMHSDNLRVDYESITSQLRVNPLFSHCASRRASFALSRRASHFAAILTILFTIGVGNVWGEDVLFSTDFSDSKWSEITSICNAKNAPDETHNGITFHSYNSNAKPFTIDQSAGTMTWCDNNMGSNYWIAIPITGVNGSITITVGNGNTKTSFKYTIKKETTISSSGGSGSNEGITAAAPCVLTRELDGKDYVVYLGRNGSSYKTIKSIKITTPTPCDGISPSLTYNKTTLQVGDQLDPTFNPDGSTGAVTYESNNTAAVTVDANGKIKAVGVGAATIKASVAAANGKCAGEATVNILVQGTTGSHTLTWNLNVVAGSSESDVTATTDIGTASKYSSSIYLTDLTNLTGVGVNRTSSGKNDNTGKIETPAAYDESKYVSMTFEVADGYGFVPSSVSIKTVAVTNAKDLKFEISDANGSSYSVTETELSTSATAAANTLDFSSCDVTFTGTVTVKIYVYGATNAYRLSTPLTIDGTVTEVETPITTTITLSSQGGTGGTASVTATYGSAMPEIDIPTRTGYNFQGYFTANGGTGTQYYNADGTSAKNWDKEDATATLYAQWECTAPTDVKISGEYVHFPGETLTLTVSGSNIAVDATYQWYKKNGDTYDELAGETANELIIDNATANDAGNYKCVVTNGTCSAENNYTVKMYSLRGLIDWSTDCSFTKVNATTATYSMELVGSSSYEFKIFDGSVYYGNTGGNPTMTSANCTNWPMQQNSGDNVTLQTTAAGTYTFTLDYSDASNLKISVTYPKKQMVYLNPNMWDANGDTEVYTVYSWQEGSNGSFVTMTSVEGCGNTNIYQAEIDASHNKLLFIRWNQAHTAWDNNRWNQSIDLDYQTNGQYKIDDWENGSELYWKDGAKKSWASHEKTFTPNYTVTFDANGYGTAPDAQCVAKNGKATTPTAPTATSYTFGGWYKEAGCTNAWDFANDVVTSDITLYAKWTANTYTVTWNPAGGNWGGNTDNIVQTYEYGAKIIAPEKPSRTGFEFVEWAPTYVANETTMPANDVTYTAQWREIAQTYTITYNLGPENWKGENPLPTYTAGTEHTLPTIDNLTNDNYGTFQGWYESADFQGNAVTSIPANATGAKTYYAKWVYSIKFFEVVDEATDVVNKEFQTQLTGASYPATYTYGVGITLPELPAKDGYTADGWYSQWCVYYEEENGLSWVDACKSTALDNNAYGNVNFAVKYTPTDDATDCPSSGTLYTAVAAATGNISIAGNTSDLELNTSTHKTTVTGGSMYVTSQQTDSKNLITANGFTMTNNNTFFKIVLDCELAAGDIISIAVGKDGSNERGVWVSSSSSRPGSAPACALTATNASLIPVTYTVTQSDEYNGKKVLYIYRATANSTYFNNINISRPVTCTTPAAPTSPTNGVTTSNSQAVSWTDTSSDAWEVYLSTSSSTPGEGQSPTAEPTTASYTFTGLTASTTYYWWVRSVCDASHKSAWVAGSSFTTNTAAATPMVIWNLNVGTSATTTIFSSGDSDDHTNIPVANITVDQTNDGANGAGASNRTTKLALATGESAASVDNPDKYELFTFKVACGKKLTPSEVKIKVANVGSTAGGNQNYKAVLSDAYGHSISNTFTGTNSDGTVEEFSITNGGGTYFQGDVTLKLWSCKGASGNASAFRMGTPVEIYGTIEEGSTPTATITWNTQPADGQVGSADFAYAVSCSDGSAVTVTSADPSIATIVDGKLHYVAAGTTHLVASATDACGNEITQNSNDFTVTAASVDPNPGTGEEKYYYGHVAIQNGALVKEITNGRIQFFTVTGGVVDNSTALSMSSTPSAAGIYYNSNNLTHEELSKSSNWGSSSTANRYIQGMKFKDATTYTLKLGSKTATSIRFYGWCGSSSRKLTIGGVEYTSSSTKNTFFAHEFIKNGSFTGDVSISGSGDFYGIIVIDITALPSCTTPVLSNLENKKVCPGSNVSWTAIVNNTATLQENGETIAYQWNKKGNNTVLSNNATLTLNDITEAAGGTYVVTATVSANGKASATATKEVTLTVTPATATPTITANANTIFAGNSVTLTATCASSGVTYQWYTCNANGTNEQAIDGATNTTYTLTAGAAGTYYYKVIVTGDGSHSCGTAEKVYELVVSSAIDASDCTTYFWFPYAQDATTNGVTNNENKFFGNSPRTGDNNSGTYEFELDDITYTATRNTGASEFTISFTVPENSIGTMAINCKGSSSKPLYLKHTDNTEILVSNSSSIKSFVIENITPGTWTLQSSGSWTLSGMAVKVCSGSSCTDPQVTATVDNATICAGTENVTFTATNYADGATLQWQKKNGNTWENISGAISATYTIPSVTTDHAGQYHVIAEAGCKRMSEEIKLTVLTAPTFNTFATTASVMKGNALAISDVQATGATGYAWYKSADDTFDAKEDTKVGTSKDLLLAAASITEEAEQIFYLFCVASNSCGTTESQAITVTVTPFVEEECATKGNEGDREFGFKNTSCGQDTYGDSKTPVWKTSSRSKYLTYTAPEGRYFATAKVTVAHTGGTKCGYAYSTNGGATWVVTELDGLSATLTSITIELPANVNAFRISRNLTAQDGEKGSDSGTFYLAEACFTYENACTETTLTAGSYNNEYNISTQMDFVEPTFTLKAGETALEGQTLTYTSSNTAIATVDEDGNVTFEGMTGTVTITATFAGGEINETEYCACQGSYTITVGCKDQAPKIVAAAGTNLNGCNNSITLEAKMQDGTTAFVDGTFQWYRDGEAIEGATSASYIVVRAGTYTVSRTYTCTTMSSNSAVVTNENVEPQVERLTPFQYYHVDKTYSNQMKGRHLFAVTSYGTLNGKRYHLTATRNGETLDLSSSTAFFTIPSSDNAVDTVMIDLNELKGKYAEGDEIVITCAPINSCDLASAITSSITIHVIGDKPTLALICSGANGEGTRDTKELVVGGDFLTGYNKADLCQQTGNKTFNPNIEWGFYTELKEKYIVTPVNGYAEFNKLNYEPFDILLLTDYPKASKSEAAATILDDMAALCDYRPLLSLKAHMVAKSPSKWAAKGFTTSPVVPATTSQYANIVCYAHPMFDDLDDAHEEGIYHDHDDFNQLVYKILTGPGHEGNKGLQGFELKDADNFVTIGLVHYNATAEVVTHDNHTHLEWTPAADDRQLVAIAERQANIEARMILFAINCGAQSMQTPMGRQVLLTCLDYLLKTDPIEVADCRLTFDNGEGNTNWDADAYEGSEGTGTKGDGLWSTAANWGPGYNVVPGRNNDVRIAAPCTVDADKVEVLSVHITKDGSLTIPANSSLTARSTILRADEDGNVYPTNVEDISLGSDAGGNASLILNNERGDTKAGVAMYSKAEADMENMSAANSKWQYIGTPHSDVQNAAKNYYDSWLYQYDTNTQGWAVIQNGGPLDPFRGYCITHPEQGHTYWMEGTLVSTTNQDITIPAGKFVVVANSWTAPIQINELTDDDMEGLRENTIYFFNTGSDSNQEGQLNIGRYAAGTYVSVPIHSAPYTGDSYIPSMQGFYVVGGTTDGTLHLDYERHVRAPRTNTPSGPMHAPARRVAADNEPQVAKFLFRGKRYDDRLIILERPDFTRGYDSGWDGEQWGGNAAAPMSYVVTETRWDAVSAIPEYEGTIIGFRAGEDSEYTIHFDYDGMEDALYLLDTDTQIYTRVLKGNSYTFTCTDKAEHNRFILTRKAPQIATGTDHINTGENAKAVKFIKDDKIFIFVNGMLYDATGKMVIR